jgi:hypothetical protein
MFRWIASIAMAVACAATVHADITITVVTSIESAMMAAAGGAPPTPKITTRIKGNKARTDVDVNNQTVSTILDLTTKQAIVLVPSQKTAHVVEAEAAAASSPAPPMPAIDTKVTATGATRQIDGVACDEYAITLKMDMTAMSGQGTVPPETAAMLKDLRVNMSGSAWVARNAPGAAEYRKFQQSARLALSALGAGGVGAGIPAGMEKIITGFSEAPGIPYLTEMSMKMEGTGPLVSVMKQMGETKVISKVTGVSTDALADHLFAVPEGYTVVKK